MVSLHRSAAMLSLVLVACSPPRLPIDDQGDASGDSSTFSTDSDSSSTTDTTVTTNVTFVPSNDHAPIPTCDPFTQDCPDGEKCVPYSRHGDNWDAFKCVSVTGEQATGEPCTYGGTAEATDDCDELSGCWHVQDLEGEAVGTCYAFCLGTADNPECPAGSSCTISGSGVPAYCIPTCDPVAQDCNSGLACYFSGFEFQCISPTQNIPAGQPCGFINDCASGLLCLTAESFSACNGSACCGLFCNLDLGDAPCEATPGTTCQPFFENDTAPPGLEHVGVCIVPGS